MYIGSDKDSAILVYHDAESAELCKKYLGDRYYKGRVLTITTEIKKNYPNAAPTAPAHSFDDELAKEISSLRPEDKKALLSMMRSMKDEGPIFEGFLESKSKIVMALLGKYQHE
jgi:hypothetical protein